LTPCVPKRCALQSDLEMHFAKMGCVGLHMWAQPRPSTESCVRRLLPGPGGIAMEPPKIGTITLELQLDWDRVGVLFASFGIACGGIATVIYSIGFLVQALSHHV
jgi:hypothetical protein